MGYRLKLELLGIQFLRWFCWNLVLYGRTLRSFRLVLTTLPMLIIAKGEVLGERSEVGVAGDSVS